MNGPRRSVVVHLGHLGPYWNTRAQAGIRPVMVMRNERPTAAYLSTGQVARTLGVTPETLRRWVSEGRLLAQRSTTGRWMIPDTEVSRMTAPDRGGVTS